MAATHGTRDVPRGDGRDGAGRLRDARPHGGILCALETAHAIAALRTVLPQLRPDATVVVSLSGRGDKDMLTIAKAMNLDMG